MGYFIITDSNWARLRNEILSLAETCHKAFGERSRHTKGQQIRQENYGKGKRFKHGYGRYAGGAVRYQRSEQTD